MVQVWAGLWVWSWVNPCLRRVKKNQVWVRYFPGQVMSSQKILTHFAMSTHHHTQAQPATTTHNHKL